MDLILGHLAVVRKSGTSQKVDDDTCLLQVPQVEEYSDVPVGSVSKKIEPTCHK
jgi:hypothetical protein